LGETIEVDVEIAGARTILKIKLPKVIESDYTLRARGYGNPAHDGSGGTGALYIKVHVGREMIGCKRIPATPTPAPPAG